METTQAIMANPKFQQLTRQRTSLGWTLALITMAIYFGLIGLVAFDKPLTAAPVGDGPVSVGIVLGLIVIIASAALVGVYVAIANSRFDALVADITREAGR